MLVLLLILVIFLANQVCSSTVSINGFDLKEEDYNVTWIYFPDGNGNLEVAFLVDTPDDKRGISKKTVEEQVRFELYTRNNTKIPEVVEFLNLKGKSETVLRNFRSFNKNIPTKIIIHGWKGTTNDPIVIEIKNQYLKQDFYNVIAVNWSKIADNFNYFEVVNNVPKVGRIVSRLINNLESDLNVNTKSIHIIGHSLGSHVAGYAGKNSVNKIARITGLDPARPLFEEMRGPDKRLSKTDANFVDVIHTCAYIFGYANPIGHIDFYPNGGSPPQPGCLGFRMISCSHGRAYEYFAESISSDKGFWSYPCNSYSNFTKHMCLKDPILMGNDAPLDFRGKYFLKTNSNSTYAFGKP